MNYDEFEEELEKKYKNLMSNSNYYKRERWDKICNENGYCSHCPPHNGENWMFKTKDRSWKNFRKTQYKAKLDCF